MAVILYEPAFVVLAKWFPEPGERGRAMTTMTLVAALASFIFLPLSQALIDAHGWRDALLILAIVLGVITIPLHALVLRRPPRPNTRDANRAVRSADAAEVLRSQPFWLLSTSFFLASMTGIAMTVLAIPYLLGRGHSASFAAAAVGLVGVSQIPGRLIFAMLAPRLPASLSVASVFALIALGIALLLGASSNVAVIAGLVVLGVGNGMATLARATVIADRYGIAIYGAVAGVAAAVNTAARALGPVAAASLAAVTSYTTLLWTLTALTVVAAALAWRSEDATTRRSPSASGASAND
jgi:predicted MFS family arabinose efflux permease